MDDEPLDQDDPRFDAMTPAEALVLWEATPPELRRLISCLSRLDRLQKMEAPDLLIDNERALIVRAAQEATLFCAGVYSEYKRPRA